MVAILQCCVRRCGPFTADVRNQPVPCYSSVSKAKSGAVLSVVFPLLTFVLLAAVKPIPLAGGLVSAAMFFSAPVMLILSATGHIDPRSPTITAIALWVHYPVLGFVIGYLSPFEVSPNRACLKKVAFRYVVLLLALGSIGLSLALYAAAHDS
jgi:hypothetical protein